MEDNGTIVLDVSMDDLIASLKELKRQYDENTAAMERLKEAGQQDTEEYVRLTQANKVLRGEMRGVETQIQNEIKAERAQEGSLIQLRAQLANLQKQYDAMSGFDRLGVAGQALQEKIKGLSDEIVNLEGSTGRWQRNVGNYKSALEGLSGGFRAAGIATGGLDASLKLLNSNPIMLFLTAIIGVFRALINAIKGTEEGTMQLNEAFAALNPVIDQTKRKFQETGDTIVNGITKAVNGLTDAVAWFLTQFQRLDNWLGGDSRMGDDFRDASKAARDLQESEDSYIKAKRKWGVESAKIDRDVADLREKATQKEKYSAKERLAFLDQAIALETKKANAEKYFAEWDLRNLSLEAARTKNSAEMNDKLAEAERAVIEADTRLSNTKRALSRQRLAAINEMKAETKETDDATVSVKAHNKALEESVELTREELKTIKELSLEESLRAAEKAAKETEKRIADIYASQSRALRKLAGEIDELERKAAGFQGLPDTSSSASVDADTTEATEKVGEVAAAVSELQGLDTHVEIDVDTDLGEGPSLIEQFAADFERNAKTITETAAQVSSSFGSLSSIYKTIAEDESRSEEEREEAARKSQAWAKAQIAANSGTAIAKGVAQAMDLPFPANLAAIASTLAAILAAIAQAKALAAESHAFGGVVGNTFSGATMGPDDTVINARHGELVINARQQRELYDLANGTQSPGVAATIAAAIAAMPAPVLDYREFTEFTQRVASIDESSKLR